MLTFSNRCSPTKAIRGWLATDERGRVALVRAYLERAGFTEVTTALRTDPAPPATRCTPRGRGWADDVLQPRSRSSVQYADAVW